MVANNDNQNKLFLAVAKFGLQLQKLKSEWNEVSFREGYQQFLGSLVGATPTKVEEQVIKELKEQAIHLAKRKGISL